MGTKPNGAIEYADGGLDIPARTTESWFPAFLIDPRQPEQWSTSNEFARASISIQLTCGDYDIDLYDLRTGTAATTSGVKAAAWATDINICSNNTVGIDTYSYTTPPVFQDFLWRLNGDNAMGGTNELLTINYDFQNDEDYDGEAFEKFGTATTRLYDKEMPCSAYLMQRILAANSNTVSSSSPSSMSVPL